MIPGEHFAVLVHGVAHELLHRDGRRKETTHTIRATEAEAVAFVVSQDDAPGETERLSPPFAHVQRRVSSSTWFAKDLPYEDTYRL